MSLRDELLRRFPGLERLPPGCYAVGGAIRDLLHGREPNDIDVACLDPLAAAGRLGGRPVRLGDQEQLSAWRVSNGGHVYDFAGLLEGNISDDLARRDFTINAMAVDLRSGELIDLHDGRGDLARRMVRMVDPSNFDDDPLRTLKGVRMAVVLAFEIEAGTLEAIRTRAPRISSVAAERVTYELSIIFAAGRLRAAIDLLDRTGLAAALELSPRAFEADDVPLAATLALLVRDPRTYGRRWRWSEQLIRDVLELQRLMDEHGRIALYDAGEGVALQLGPMLRAVGRDDVLDLPDFTIRALLSGEEIAEVSGLPPGKDLGAAKRALLEAQIGGEVADRDAAGRFVKDWASSRQAGG